MSKTLPLVAVLALASCASWMPVQHTPKSSESANLAEDFMRLVMTTRGRWKPAKIDVKESFAVLSYINQYGVQTVTLPYNEIAKIELLSNKGKEWDVDVLDAKGKRLFRYLAGDEAKAREFVDVMTAIAKPAPKDGPPAVPAEKTL